MGDANMIPVQPVRISARRGIALRRSKKPRETAHSCKDQGLVLGLAGCDAACPCVNFRFLP
jgi:hypothetical protein